MPAARLVQQLLDLVFPTECAGCGAPGGAALCSRCVLRLSASRRDEDVSVLPLPAERCAFSAVRAGGVYGGVLKDAVLRLKESERPVARPLSLLMLAAAGNDPDYIRADLVCCVPSTTAKVRARGYNPAAVLGRLVASRLGIPFEESLKLGRPAADQDGLNALERRVNIIGAFEVVRRVPRDSKILLVDDVFTTGATADACSLALTTAGAGMVVVLVAARAILGLESASALARFGDAWPSRGATGGPTIR